MREISFTKMQGAGNDYVYVDCFKENFSYEDGKKYAKFLSNRNYGIGSDGLILICKSKSADAKMIMFNSDGSEGEMCGNGLRCVAKYVYEHNISKNNLLNLETGRGILKAELFIENSIVKQVEIDMDKPILEGLKIPTTIDKNPIINHPIEIDGKTFYFTAVSMGNPHAVIYVESIDKIDVAGIGSKIEHHPFFPNRMHAEFVEILSKDEVRQRTWERGSGETLACGTGASAVCVAGVISGRTNNKILNHLLGGDLILRYDGEGKSVFMKGGCVEVFNGKIILPEDV